MNTMSYIFIAAPLGSIRELPSLSCHEIKASEGKDSISKKYWLDPARTGKAALLYCDMKMEGKSYLHKMPSVLSRLAVYASLFIKVLLFFYVSITCHLDIDECKDDNNACDVNANCTNTHGSYNCTCKEGYAHVQVPT